MSITIERNQKIQSLQIIEKKKIYIYIYLRARLRYST